MDGVLEHRVLVAHDHLVIGGFPFVSIVTLSVAIRLFSLFYSSLWFCYICCCCWAILLCGYGFWMRWCAIAFAIEYGKISIVSQVYRFKSRLSSTFNILSVHICGVLRQNKQLYCILRSQQSSNCRNFVDQTTFMVHCIWYRICLVCIWLFVFVVYSGKNWFYCWHIRCEHQHAHGVWSRLCSISFFCLRIKLIIQFRFDFSTGFRFDEIIAFVLNRFGMLCQTSISLLCISSYECEWTCNIHIERIRKPIRSGGWWPINISSLCEYWICKRYGWMWIDWSACTYAAPTRM